jgi:hypothetical protein
VLSLSHLNCFSIIYVVKVWEKADSDVGSGKWMLGLELGMFRIFKDKVHTDSNRRSREL